MSPKNVTKVVWYILVQLSFLIEKILSTKIIKSQITKHKYQTNYNDQNSKSQMFWTLKIEI
jgi:hypothetical protein